MPRSRAPRTSSVSTWRLPPDRRASSASACEETGRSSARWSSAPSSSCDSGSRSRRIRWPSRCRPVSRGDGVPPVRIVPMRKTVRETMSGTKTATDVSSSRSRSSTSRTSRSSPASRRSSAREAWNSAVRSSSPTPRSCTSVTGSRCASAPSGIACRRRMADRPLDRPPGTLGPAQGLLGETGLADAGRALQHHTTARTIAVEMADLFELGGPPREGPRRDHDPPGARRRRPPITRITRTTLRRARARPRPRVVCQSVATSQHLRSGRPRSCVVTPDAAAASMAHHQRVAVTSSTRSS